ncbi:flagellar hook-associated protein FlgK [Alkalilacustris brevis]|uniref:flagellar hook-associated protein FlgK n=1 Tax=Alkalilacustris brevis TaxID=2026338 RepID=UPI000E0DFBE8|nr:flagellar hook-associated protein FlgK [Alkalilacustris brevis]
MSLGTSLSAALSGLAAASKTTEVISSNIANAATGGYAPRQISLAARGNGMSGVSVDGVQRLVDLAVLSEARIANAGRDDTGTRAEALQRLDAAFGMPGEGQSLTGLIDRLEASLIEAASRPDSETRLDAALFAARELASGVNRIAGEVQTLRSEAEQQIAADAEHLNTTLARIHDLNQQIARHAMPGNAPNTLLDQRSALIDSISGLVPLRQVARPHGGVALVTQGGAVLLDHKPAEIGFAAVPAITPEMSLGNGALSALTLNGRPVSTDTGGQMGGGRIEALFAVRDEIAPGAQQGLDALARDLVARFEAADAASPAPLGLGLFTDAGAALDPAQEPGLAQRLALNPVTNDAAWRLRSGLGAALPGPAGDTATLSLLAQALSGPPVPASGGAFAGNGGVSAAAGQVHSQIGTARQAADERAAFSAARADSLHEMQLEKSVDTDAELQKLLIVERSYAANARVLRAVDEMLQTLVKI